MKAGAERRDAAIVAARAQLDAAQAVLDALVRGDMPAVESETKVPDGPVGVRGNRGKGRASHPGPAAARGRGRIPPAPSVLAMSGGRDDILRQPSPAKAVNVGMLESVAASQSSAASTTGSTRKTEGKTSKRREARPLRAGAPGAPARRGRNLKEFADHFFITADHVSPEFTKSHMHLIMEGAWKQGKGDQPDDIRGVVVEELHKDGSRHIHGAVLADKYMPPATLISQAREADVRIRGHRVPADKVRHEVLAGGKGRGRKREIVRDVPGTGVPWHLNLLFHHQYQLSDKQVKAGMKAANSYKSAWTRRPQTAAGSVCGAPVVPFA